MRSLAWIAVRVLAIGPASLACSPRLYDQVREIIAANLPHIFLARPNLLVGAKKNLENFKTAILEPTKWDVEQLYFRRAGAIGGAKR